MSQAKISVLPIPEHEVVMFSIEYKICFLYTISGRKFAVDFSLERLEEFLSPALFYRANRKIILRRDATLTYRNIPARKLEVQTLVPVKYPITIPKAKVSRFKKWLASA